MSLFFVLSGFLIVSMLLRDQNFPSFLIRRFCRILPLAWPVLIILLLIYHASAAAWAANVLFYANLPPFFLDFDNGHFWSLCVELQFYVSMAFLVLLLGKKALYLVPILCVGVTLFRVWSGEPVSIVTWFRLDDILVGGCLALAVSFDQSKRVIARISPWIYFLFPILVLCSDPDLGPVGYIRPYIAVLVVASTLYRANDLLRRTLTGSVLGYIAKISYALYVIHPLTRIEHASFAIKLIGRIFSFAATFIFAHLSTTYYESRWIKLGHKLSRKLHTKPPSDILVSRA